MTRPSSVHEQIRAMGMTEEQTRAAIQDFERAEVIVQALFTAARSIGRFAAATSRVLRRTISSFPRRSPGNVYNSRGE